MSEWDGDHCHILSRFDCTMELSEVVNAHFAVPVVGVVLCAFLVFAFGFKSPGQPPSFDAVDEDDRKYKKSRQRKPGHADKRRSSTVVIDDVDTSSKSSVISSKQTSLSSNGSGVSRCTLTKQPTNIAIVADVSAVSKTKQGRIVKKPYEVVELSAADVIPKRDNVAVGEWTTAVSKKERKHRGKRDETIKFDKVFVSHDVTKGARTRSNSPSALTSKTNKKQLEVTTVTVVVPAPTSASLSVATTTSTTVTQNAVIKVKIIPNVRVVAGVEQTVSERDSKATSKLAACSSRKGFSGQSSISLVSPTRSGISADRSTSRICPMGDTTDVQTDIHEKWSEVKSAKNQKRAKNIVDVEDKYKEIPAVANSGMSSVGDHMSKPLISNVAKNSIPDCATVSAPLNGSIQPSVQPILSNPAAGVVLVSVPQHKAAKVQTVSVAKQLDRQQNSRKDPASMPKPAESPSCQLLPAATAASSEQLLLATTSAVISNHFDNEVIRSASLSPTKTTNLIRADAASIKATVTTTTEAVSTAVSAINIASAPSHQDAEQFSAEDGTDSLQANLDGDELQSGDEHGDWFEAKSQKKKRRLRKDI
jgi:hypothetical protein